MRTLITLFFLISIAYAQKMPAIIPQPKNLSLGKGQFEFNNETQFFCKTEDQQIVAALLKEQLRAVKLFNNKIVSQKPKVNFVQFSEDKSLKAEAYTISVGISEVIIKASSASGYFYAYQTLMQLFSPEIYSSSYVSSFKATIPVLKIEDEPRFTYRGFMLDVGRYYMPISYIKKLINALAMHKINVLHWHLTEDQGWRIEIKKYPLLTEIGSIRKESPEGHYRDKKGNGQPHSGFYTQVEIKDLVAYAQKRHITIIPEIEMPGHALAAIAAYPSLACTDGPFEVRTRWSIENTVLCPEEETFRFLEDVLTEVIDLFPSQYIHIGGDECPKDNWKASAFCQELIKKEKLKDEHELQSYFIKRIDKFLTSKGKKILGWDEILEGGLSENATVMTWRGMKGGLDAAMQKHDVIMSTRTHLYFDYYQGDIQNEPLAIGGQLPLEKVYSLDPFPEGLKPEFTKYIKGVQAQLWSEYVSTPEKADYMAFPRVAALAEVAWSLSPKNYEKFRLKMPIQTERYAQLGINYAKTAFDIKFDYNPTDLSLKLSSAYPEFKIKYSLDGSEPTNKSAVYEKPLLLSSANLLKAKLFSNNNEPLGRALAQPYNYSKTFRKKVSLKNPAEVSTANILLTDGLLGAKYDNKGWVAFKDVDAEIDLDLDVKYVCNALKINFLTEPAQSAFLPSSISISGSNDGVNFEEVQALNNIDSNNAGLEINKFSFSLKNKSYRYIKVLAKQTRLDSKTKKLLIDDIIID